MATFTGTLNSNEIFASMYNMVISQQVFADNIDGLSTSLVDKARVDGSMYGDTKLYYATDVLGSIPWEQDSQTATNLLELHRPEAPDCQAIELDVFRQIALTVDEYMSKRAWSTEGAFSQFNSQMLAWLRDTKRVYDTTLYNAFIGTTRTTEGRQNIDVDISTATTGLTGNEKARVEAQTIAQTVADLLDDLKDVSRDFNDYGNLRAYAPSKIKVIWNNKWVNKLTKLDLPTMFHKDGLVDKIEEEKINARFFGDVCSDAMVTDDGPLKGNKVQAGFVIRSLVEKDLNQVKRTDPSYDPKLHYFPGDQIATGTTVGGSSAAFLYTEAYEEDPDVIAKIVVKLPPYMSAFEVGTSFFNSRNLSTNHYLTFGHNTLEYLMNYPFITLNAD